MATTERVRHRERCRLECTRDVIFLLRRRTSKSSTRPGWEIESVWLTREEAEAHAKCREYRYPLGWQVYGVCAEGELAELLRAT